MRLNKEKWIQEVRRVEAEIKFLTKKKMREPGYERTFPYSGLHALKAEATRLYTLRRVMKKRSVELKSFWHLAQSRDGKYVWVVWKTTDNLDADQVVSLILDGVTGWRDNFLLDDPIETIPSQSAIVEAVVS